MWLAFKIMGIVSADVLQPGYSGRSWDIVIGIGALGYVAATLFAGMMVLRWIHQVNGNVHAFGAPITITPGWAVGWFFVPVASLFKPFEAMKQTWAGSVATAAPELVETPGLLRLWWGLWLVQSFFDILSERVADPVSTVADFASSGVSIVLTPVFVRIIRELTAIQRGHMQGAVFA